MIVHWTLRIAAFACYVGHGAFGIITKAAWVPYFGIIGIPEWMAWRLMPVVGTVDIILGILVLIRPMPVVLLYMTGWSIWTALLPPLHRRGLVGVPGASRQLRCPARLPVLEPTRPAPAAMVRRHPGADGSDRPSASALAWILRITTAALLIGHGGFGAFMHKAAWAGYFGAVGHHTPDGRRRQPDTLPSAGSRSRSGCSCWRCLCPPC